MRSKSQRCGPNEMWIGRGSGFVQRERTSRPVHYPSEESRAGQERSHIQVINSMFSIPRRWTGTWYYTYVAIVGLTIVIAGHFRVQVLGSKTFILFLYSVISSGCSSLNSTCTESLSSLSTLALRGPTECTAEIEFRMHLLLSTQIHILREEGDGDRTLFLPWSGVEQSRAGGEGGVQSRQRLGHLYAA